MYNSVASSAIAIYRMGQMRDQTRITGTKGMVYRKGTLEDRKSTRRTARFGGVMENVIVDIPFPLAVSSKLLDDFGFTEIIDSSLDWDPKQCKTSPGDACKSIVMATSSIKERPAIMNIGLNYEELPLDLLFDTVQSAADLDRFSLAEHLDRLYEAGTDKVYLKVASAVRAHYEIVSKRAHSDTTSVNVWGMYDSDYQNDGGIDITYGYSKDRRPDLKQYMIGKVVDENGISIYSRPLDGNTSDVEWNQMCLDSIEDVLRREDMIYVADSKVVTDRLIKRLDEAGIRFVSRLPENFGNSLQARILKDVNVSDLVIMEKIPGEEKRTDRAYKEVAVEWEGIALRAIPQITSHNRGKGDRAVQKARDSFSELLESFPRIYDCRKDAEHAFLSFEKKVRKKHPMFSVSARYSEFEVSSRGRGRPRKDGTDVHTERYVRVEIDHTEIDEIREALWKSKEFIVMITNIPSKETDPDRGLGAEDVIRTYTGQWTVESKFATEKRPAIADRLFLEKQSRAEALITLFDIGVLLRGLIQLLIRRGVAEIPDGMLPSYGVDHGPLQRNVTHAYFIQQFQNVNLHYYPHAAEYVLSNQHTAEKAKFFMDIMGIDAGRLFSRSSECSEK